MNDIFGIILVQCAVEIQVSVGPHPEPNTSGVESVSTLHCMNGNKDRLRQLIVAYAGSDHAVSAAALAAIKTEFGVVIAEEPPPEKIDLDLLIRDMPSEKLALLDFKPPKPNTSGAWYEPCLKRKKR